jgi:hypothetical protein
MHQLKKWRWMLGLAIVSTAAAISGGGGGGTSLPGRLTGGGSIINNGIRVTHGFQLNCDATVTPQNLQINWPSNKFHLEQLNSAFCSADPSIGAGQPAAGFNTYSGSGTGRLNGVDGATVDFIFTDAGEPGTNDTAAYTIYDSAGTLVLTASGNLDKGNHQAHNP